MFLNEQIIKRKLEDIYAAQEKYLELVKNFEKEMNDFSYKNRDKLKCACFLDYDEILGYEKCEMVSVEHSMDYIKKRCDENKVTFAKDDRTFFYTGDSTKQDLLDFLKERKGYGTTYIQLEDDPYRETDIFIMEFTNSTPYTKYDSRCANGCIAEQVSLEELVNILDEYCIKELSEIQAKKEQQDNLEMDYER